MFLIYRQGTRGPTPAKCEDLPLVKSVNGNVAELVGQPIKLTAKDFALPLAVLERMYPPPKPREPEPRVALTTESVP